MFQINEKVKFKEGLFTKVFGDVVFVVTDIYSRGDVPPYGDVYNGSDELYRIVTDNPAVPKQLSVSYQKEYCLRSAEKPSKKDDTPKEKEEATDGKEDDEPQS